MGKRTVTTTKTYSDGAEEVPAVDATPPDPPETWTAFRGKFAANQGAKVKVYRNTPKGRQYCFSDPPSAVDEESIRIFHANQDYRSEPGEYLLALEIDGAMQDPFPVYIAPQVAIPGAELKTPNMYGGMADMFRMMMDRLDRMEQRTQQQQTPMVEMVDALHKLDQIRGGASAQQTNPLMGMDTLLKCIEIGQGMGPGANKEWWQYLIEAVKDNAPLLQVLAARMMAGQQAPPQPGTAPPPVVTIDAPPPQQAATAEQPPQQPTEADMKLHEEMMLKGVIAFLKKKALQQSDPELYVAMVCDNQEEPTYAKLISEIVDKDFSAFATVDPDIEKPQYRGFFCAIYDGLRSEFGPKNTVASIASRQSGNARNAPGNGTTGAKRGK